MSQKPKLLFVCIGNSCRSQMAEGLAKELSDGRCEAFSAGSRPLGIVHPLALQAMKDIGIDISKHYSKGLHQIPQEKYDAVVTMGCGDVCPQIPARSRIDLNIADPYGLPYEAFVTARNQIREEVLKLLTHFGLLSS